MMKIKSTKKYVIKRKLKFEDLNIARNAYYIYEF